jgi:PAS domain S-box-containing protein
MGGRAPVDDGPFLARLIDAVADPIFVKDRKHRFVLVNDALCALVGRRREELLGRTDYDFFPKEQADEFRRRDEQVFASGRENANEETLTDAAGVLHTLVTKKAVLKAASGERYLVGVIRDVTELARAVEALKENQARLRRAQKLELIGRMAGGLAHDFNNALTAIQCGSGLLLDLLEPDHPARLEAEGIRVSSDLASRLAKRMLSFSRRPEGDPVVVDPVVIAGEMRRMLELVLPPGARLRLELSDQACGILVDPGRFEQVLLNLVVNAGEALDGSGAVEVRIAPERGCALKDGCVRLTVRDDGRGMSERERTKLFTSFRSTKDGGEGIGLSTVDEIMRAAGGAVTVESEPGRGSSFHAHWPAATAKPVRPRTRRG